MPGVTEALEVLCQLLATTKHPVDMGLEGELCVESDPQPAM